MRLEPVAEWMVARKDCSREPDKAVPELETRHWVNLFEPLQTNLIVASQVHPNRLNQSVAPELQIDSTQRLPVD